MNKNLLLLLSLLLVWTSCCDVHAQDDWHVVKSSDGVIEAMLPGPAKKILYKKKTIAGTITTRILQFHTAEVEFSVSSTRLSKFIRRFADEERLYKIAKNGVLNRLFGKEKSFEKIKLDGVDARALHYEVVNFEDETHNGYDGLAIFLVLNSKVYAANAIMAKEDGNADLKKFRESIKLKKEDLTGQEKEE